MATTTADVKTNKDNLSALTTKVGDNEII